MDLKGSRAESYFREGRINFLDANIDRWGLVICCAFFGSIFMIIYNPLAIQRIVIYSWLGNLLTVKFAAIVGACVVAFNQFVIRPLFKIRSFSIRSFIPWIVFEVIMISLVIFIIYKEYQEATWAEYLIVAKYSVGISLPPYLLACLILMLRNSYGRDQISAESEHHVDSPSQVLSDEYIKIKDINDKEQFIVKAEMLLFAESKNNYVDISYLDGEVIRDKRVRNTLKNLEGSSLSTAMLRVHRSYMVNLNQVSHINRQGPKWTIKLSHENAPLIPVSTSYQATLELAHS